MSVAYVDTSWLAAMAFDEPDADQLARALDAFDVLLATHMTEAELTAAHVREGAPPPGRFLEGLTWVYPDRRLTRELERVLAFGYVRGADLLHLATALYAAESPADVTFLTLDERQREVATRVGFATPA